MKTLFYNARLIDAQTDAVGAILVDDGIIDKIWKNQDCDVAYESYKDDESVQKIDVQTHVLMPSFIELHAHFRDPGLTHKEDIQSGSQAAVAGGYGSVVLMANTSPPVSDIQTVRQNAQKARNIGLIDIFQTVSITQGFDGDTISHLQTLNAEEVPMV
ncbi:MAG: dihydroorotase, partial [Spirochaetales bacterium]